MSKRARRSWDLVKRLSYLREKSPTYPFVARTRLHNSVIPHSVDNRMRISKRGKFVAIPFPEVGQRVWLFANNHDRNWFERTYPTCVETDNRITALENRING